MSTDTLDKSKIKKVIAVIKEQYVEPDYYALYNCPYCHFKHRNEIFEDNCTITQKCESCKRKFKIKIPKFY